MNQNRCHHPSFAFFRHFLSVTVLLFMNVVVFGQELQMMESGRKTSLRGLSVVSEKVIWASGSNGMVARSVDGGKHFDWQVVPGYANRDFRDIEATDSNTALIMAIDTPAVILKTRDGGKTWSVVFEDDRPGMFLDAMSFHGSSGMVVGDPVGGRAFLAKTKDAGDSWQVLEGPLLQEGEAFFASSGSNVGLLRRVSTGNNNDPEQWEPAIVSGGVISRFFMGNTVVSLPVKAGRNSSGANGMAIHPSGRAGIVFGGDFALPQEADSSMLHFVLDGDMIKLQPPLSKTSGYKSSVVYLSEEVLVACGTSGVDYSTDGGLNWIPVSPLPFHVAASAKGSGMVWLAGPGGRIATFFKKVLDVK
jgi:Photosynthesis system II assembly factor YCF48